MPTNMLVLLVFVGFAMRVHSARVRPRVGIEKVHSAQNNKAREFHVAPEEEAPAVNDDRLQCIRQDNLDLVFPSSQEYILRKVIGISGDSTGRDVYVTASQVRIDKIAATLTIQRVGPTNFKFMLTGPSNFGEAQTLVKNVAVVDFFLGGLDVRTPSVLIDWVTSLASNRDKLQSGQAGQLYFKLSGEAAAEWDDTEEKWAVNLLHTKVDPFQFQITDQFILQEALTRAGGIDEIIMSNLWPAIKAAIPMSLAQAFQTMPPEELDFGITADISGKMEAGGPLQLVVDVKSNLDVVPAAALEAFQRSKHNFVEFAEREVDKWLASESLQELWETSREVFLDQMSHLGMLFDDETEAWIANAKSLQDIRPQLLEAARSRADGLLKSLQPFLDAKNEGKDGFFEGVQISSSANAGWTTQDDGRISASLASATPCKDCNATSPVITLPAAFLDAIGKSFPSQGEEGAEVKQEGFSFETGSLKYARTALHGLLSTGDDTATIIYKMQVEATDIDLSLPRSVDLGVSLSCDKVLLKTTAAGDVTFSVSDGGLQIKQAPAEEVPALVIGDVRAGAATKIDGVLSPELARPATPQDALSRTTLAPTASAKVDLKVVGYSRSCFWNPSFGYLAVGD